MISLWSHTHTGPEQLVAWHRSASGYPIWPACDTSAGSMVVIVGDTHRIQLSAGPRCGTARSAGHN